MSQIAASITPLPRHASRRRGQALLIAVLIMIFAALLGSTFVALVAVNLSPGSFALAL